jgi:DAK2 domain fusion protein YloV
MNAAEFARHFSAAADFLASRKDDVNKLNVFPVPDGDTGTNMSLTIMSVVKELEALPATASLADLRKAVTYGSLMGARGNSGVITSQIMRGFCEGLEGASVCDAPTLSIALDKSVEVSFAAVRRPVEGTILTVISDIARAAGRAAEADLDLQGSLRYFVDEAFASVRRTPDLLPVLRENNVVDAGGYGLALLVQGFVSSFLGEAVGPVDYSGAATAVAVPSSQGDLAAAASGVPSVAIEQIDDWEGSEYLYCTEFLLNSERIDIGQAIAFLASMGDCELLVGSHPDFKVHVHTNQPGQVLAYMTERGQVLDVHVHNMRLQSLQRDASLAGDVSAAAGGAAAGGVSAAVGSPVATTSPSQNQVGLAFDDAIAAVGRISNKPKRRGYIAVASGIGMQRILESLGVDIIVNGGQTMNPSTAELLEAIKAVNADEVVVFPNNKNIVMAAQAAADVSDKRVVVIPTKSVPESFSALFTANADQPLEVEVEEMVEAAALVRAAEVTRAVKDATSAHGQAIKAGDVIGIASDSIEVVGSEIAEVAMRLIAMITEDDCDTLTLLAGEQMAQPDFERLVAQIAEVYPDLEVDARRGEQPLYPLVMAAE